MSVEAERRWFTEGFDTKDLKDAKGLLEELGGCVMLASAMERRRSRLRDSRGSP